MGTIRSTFRRKFVAGLIVSVPILFTFLILKAFLQFVDRQLEPLLRYLMETYLEIPYVPGVGFLASLLIIFILGVISTNVFGKRILGALEAALGRIPVFKGVYSAFKQLVDAFSPENRTSFKKFVIVQYPRKGAWCFGFLTKECSLQSRRDGWERALKTVYVPTNNLYLGEVVLFDENEIIITDIPIQEGIKIILSGGIAAPAVVKEAVEQS